MASPVDRYIRRVTQGLPREERLERAAELRGHLLGRVQGLRLEGFDQEEAEHLAVKAMGPVAPVNRRFLGHLFTVPLGWTALSVLLIVLGGWWVSAVLFAPKARIVLDRDRSETASSLLGVSASHSPIFHVTLPIGATSLTYGRAQGGTSTLLGTYLFATGGASPRQPEFFLSLVDGKGEHCPAGGNLQTVVVGLRVFGGGGGRTEYCHALSQPFSGSTITTLFGADGNRDSSVLQVNTWVPLYLYQPLDPAHNSTARLAPADDWFAYYLWVSDDEQDHGRIPVPPTFYDLARSFSYEWLLRDLYEKQGLRPPCATLSWTNGLLDCDLAGGGTE